MSTKKKLKVLMLTYEDPISIYGGMGVHVSGLTRELEKTREAEVVVLCLPKEGRGGFFLQGEEVDFVDWEGSLRFLKCFNTNDLIFSKPQTEYVDLIIYQQFLTNALRFLKEENFDLIHLHDSTLWRVAEGLGYLWEIPIIVTCHLSFYLCSQLSSFTSKSWVYISQTESTAFKRAEGIIAVSSNYKERLVKEMFVPREVVKVIFNGVDKKFLETVKRNENVYETLKEGKEKLCVFVGRLVPSKGIEFLLRLAKSCPSSKFILITSVLATIEEVNPLKKLLDEYGGENIEWLCNIPQERKWSIMKVADIGLVPSLHEPFGIVALEWMGLGVPLVTSGVDGLKDFCNNSNATVLPLEIEKWKREIGRKKINELKRKRALLTAESYSWKRAARETLNYYREVRNGWIKSRGEEGFYTCGERRMAGETDNLFAEERVVSLS